MSGSGEQEPVGGRGGVPAPPASGATAPAGPAVADRGADVARPANRSSGWRTVATSAEAIVFLLGVILAVVVWAIAPSAGNYDTVLDLVWAQELLDGVKPGFTAYAASTPHPAWLALGVPVVAIFGDDGDRVMVLISALSLAVLAAGTVRVGRLLGEAVVRGTGAGSTDGAVAAGRRSAPGVDGGMPIGPGGGADGAATVDEREQRARRTGLATGLVAGFLTLSSFAFLLLAARGYLDVPFLALVAWAGAWILARPERWRGPAILLAVAGLLRPEAWLLAGLYWLWCTLRGRWAAADERLPGRVGHAALVLVAPVVWVAIDAIVTGHPFHSLTATSQLADDLGRERGIARAPRLLASALAGQSRPPIAAAGLVGLAIVLFGDRVGLARPARRVIAVVLALLGAGVVTFLAAGVAGLSLIPRYLTVPVVTLTVLAALAATGWVGLDPGHRWRRPWAIVVVIAAVVGVGGYLAIKRDAVTRLSSELRFLADTRREVRALIDDPAVREGARCGPISLPTYRLVPEIRLQLDVDGTRVLARSDPRAARLGVDRRGVAITVAEGKPAQRYGRADGVPRSTQPAPPGFRPVARRGPFTAWVRCD